MMVVPTLTNNAEMEVRSRVSHESSNLRKPVANETPKSPSPAAASSSEKCFSFSMATPAIDCTARSIFLSEIVCIAPCIPRMEESTSG